MNSSTSSPIPSRITTLLVYGRAPLAFAGLICAILTMILRNPSLYFLGMACLVIAMVFDLVDGWFAARFQPHHKLAELAERLMDKLVYSLIFPLVAFGMMWRFHHLPESSPNQHLELFHAMFVLLLAIIVLMRDHFAHFMLGFAQTHGEAPGMRELSRLRTMAATPVGAFLYGYAFYIPEAAEVLPNWLNQIGGLSLQTMMVLEVFFLIINFGSIASYCRKYGTFCLDDLCLGDVKLRRQILATLPNSLTVMNALMGLLAIWFAQQQEMHQAYIILVGAAFFDKLDGALARKLGLIQPPDPQKKRNITTGGILDDISDGVSFCLAPAIIFYILMDRIDHPGMQMLPYGLIAIIYAVAGIARLIAFTLDTTPTPGFFKGIPTPGAALLVTAPFIMLEQARLSESSSLLIWVYLCSGMMILCSLLMNFYKIRYIHAGRYFNQNPWMGRATTLILVVFAFTDFFGYVAFIYMLGYAISPLLIGKNSQEVSNQESHNPAHN
ncbi:MAG: CDP-alcohol phosphatidyltransferase family protein [bacterium]